MKLELILRRIEPAKLWKQYKAGSFVLKKMEKPVTLQTSTGGHFMIHPIGEVSPGPHQCRFCRTTFTHTPCQIPLNFSQGTYNAVFTCCTYECSLAFIYLRLRLFDARFKHSESLLKILFNQDYPGETLKPAADPDLLVHNGGHLTPSQYQSKHQFLGSMGIITSVALAILEPTK